MAHLPFSSEPTTQLPPKGIIVSDVFGTLATATTYNSLLCQLLAIARDQGFAIFIRSSDLEIGKSGLPVIQENLEKPYRLRLLTLDSGVSLDGVTHFGGFHYLGKSIDAIPMKIRELGWSDNMPILCGFDDREEDLKDLPAALKILVRSRGSGQFCFEEDGKEIDLRSLYPRLGLAYPVPATVPVPPLPSGI